jgi:hypothetical protein
MGTTERTTSLSSANQIRRHHSSSSSSSTTMTEHHEQTSRPKSSNLSKYTFHPVDDPEEAVSRIFSLSHQSTDDDYWHPLPVEDNNAMQQGGDKSDPWSRATEENKSSRRISIDAHQRPSKKLRLEDAQHHSERVSLWKQSLRKFKVVSPPRMPEEIW